MIMSMFPNILGLFVTYEQLVESIVTTLVFVAIGLVFFGIAFGILTLVTPFSIRKEIEEDQNTALGIVIGSVLIGIAIIIAATVQG